MSGTVSAKPAPPSARRIRSTAGQDVEPLVVAADLQDALVLAIQVQEVVRLDQRVIQLDEAEALLLKTFPVRAVLHQLVDGEVSANVAQEGQVVQAAATSRRCSQSGRGHWESRDSG